MGNDSCQGNRETKASCWRNKLQWRLSEVDRTLSRGRIDTALQLVTIRISLGCCWRRRTRSTAGAMTIANFSTTLQPLIYIIILLQPNASLLRCRCTSLEMTALRRGQSDRTLATLRPRSTEFRVPSGSGVSSPSGTRVKVVHPWKTR